MAKSGNSGICTLVCWIVAIVIGLFVVKLTAGGMPVVVPLFIGLIVALLVGMLLSKMFCKSGAAPQAAPVKSATQKAAEADAKRAARAQKERESAAAAAARSEQEAAAKAEQDAADLAAAEAARKAAEDAAMAMAAQEVATNTAAEADEAAVEPEETVQPVEVKSSLLSGQEELAARKGEWTYDAVPTEAAAASEAAEKNADNPAQDTAPADEASQPTGLAAAREGGADDLKQIKGVGPKLEQLLNSLGIFHFDQIAGWGAADIAWMDNNLKGFKGRVSRDAWAEQAKTLAGGGETEFSKRVEDGGVY